MQLFHSFVPDLVVNNTESTKRPMVPLIGFLPSCATRPTSEFLFVSRHLDGI